MNPNDSALIKDITISLYSSLDLEKSLHEVLILLKEYIPIELVHVFTFNRELLKLSYLAEATIERGILIDEEISLGSSQVRDFINIPPGEVFLLDSRESSALKFIQRFFGSKNENLLIPFDSKFQAMVISFDIFPPLIGGFGIVARGINSFDESSIAVMNLIKRPLIGAVLNLLHHREVVRENKELSRQKDILEYSLERFNKKKIIGLESGLKNVFQMISQVAYLESPVLILGETGTGKELVADEIHRRSGRSCEKMVKVNCGAIPETLMESELFGHEKGAFTGAFERTKGFFEQGDGGTIFFDEIGELSLAAQARLLRVLQTMEFHRVGGSSPVSVNVRVIAATNRDLQKMVREKRFREDLWFRLNVFPIFIPPLRERIEDIHKLAIYFTGVKSREMNLEKEPEIKKSALEVLKLYNWPGNVRELENIIERALILKNKGPLSFEGIISPARDGGEIEAFKGETEFFSMDKMMKKHIMDALEISSCRVEGRGGAAELLGMHPSTLRSRMKKLGISLGKKVLHT